MLTETLSAVGSYLDSGYACEQKRLVTMLSARKRHHLGLMKRGQFHTWVPLDGLEVIPSVR